MRSCVTVIRAHYVTYLTVEVQIEDRMVVILSLSYVHISISSARVILSLSVNSTCTNVYSLLYIPTLNKTLSYLILSYEVCTPSASFRPLLYPHVPVQR